MLPSRKAGTRDSTKISTVPAWRVCTMQASPSDRVDPFSQWVGMEQNKISGITTSHPTDQGLEFRQIIPAPQELVQEEEQESPYRKI